MSFNTDKEIGTNFILLITPLATEQMEQIEKDLLSYRQFSEIEAFRFRFCLMILNLVTAIWCINIFESNTNRAKRIIDSMVETFIGAFERKQDPIKIGDLIVDPLEIELIDSKMGQIGIGKETMTSYRTLIPIIWNKRILEYVNAFEEAKAVLEKEGKSGFSPALFRPIAKYFVRHFTGDSWKKHADFVEDISPFLTSWDMAIHNIVKEVLGGVEPKVKQESSVASKFKNREEYEVWKARKIKENEQKRQGSRAEESNINHCYEILGLEPTALKEEMEQAYKDLHTVWNPDEFTNEPSLQQKAWEKVKEIDEAYEKLILHLSKPRKQTIRIQPDDVDAYYNLGVKHEKIGMYKEAIEAYKRAIMIKPDYAKANYGLGIAYLYSGQKDKAIEQYQELKKINKKLAEELFEQIYK